MKLQIEKATLRDIDEIEQMYNDLHDYLATSTNYPGWKKDVYPTRYDAEKGISENSLFVVKHNSRIIGSYILNHNPAPGYETVSWLCDNDYKDILVIHTFVVHPSYANQGIGTQLLTYADAYAKQHHIASIRLDVYVNNTPAIQLYEKCGYQYLSNIDEGLGCYGLDEFRVYEKLIEMT